MQLNVWPVFLTSITTSIGFLSLNFSEMPPFQIMGNMVAFGSVCAFIFAVTLLPTFLSYMPMRVRPAREKRVTTSIDSGGSSYRGAWSFCARSES